MFTQQVQFGDRIIIASAYNFDNMGVSPYAYFIRDIVKNLVTDEVLFDFTTSTQIECNEEPWFRRNGITVDHEPHRHTKILFYYDESGEHVCDISYVDILVNPW